jgi:hypothetical protein
MGWHRLHLCLISLRSPVLLPLLLLLLVLLRLLQMHCLVVHSTLQPQALLLLHCQTLLVAQQLQQQLAVVVLTQQLAGQVPFQVLPVCPVYLPW